MSDSRTGTSMCSGLLGQVAHGDLEAALAGLEPPGDLAVEGVEVVADDDHVAGLVVQLDDVALAHGVARVATRFPFTLTWPWTNWRAWARLAPQPARWTTLSSRRSSSRSRFSPVTPF